MDCSPPGSSVRELSRQEYWSGLPRPPPGDLPNPGMEPGSPALAGRFFTVWATREAPGKRNTWTLSLWWWPLVGGEIVSGRRTRCWSEERRVCWGRSERWGSDRGRDTDTEPWAEPAGRQEGHTGNCCPRMPQGLTHFLDGGRAVILERLGCSQSKSLPISSAWHRRSQIPPSTLSPAGAQTPGSRWHTASWRQGAAVRPTTSLLRRYKEPSFLPARWVSSLRPRLLSFGSLAFSWSGLRSELKSNVKHRQKSYGNKRRVPWQHPPQTPRAAIFNSLCCFLLEFTSCLKIFTLLSLDLRS